MALLTQKQLEDFRADEAAIGKWLKIKSSARKRGIDFRLTLSDVKRVMRTKRCFYSGVELTNDALEDGASVPDTHLTFERVNSALGYIPGNVKAASNRMNQVRGSGTLEELQQVVARITRHMEAKHV